MANMTTRENIMSDTASNEYPSTHQAFRNLKLGPFRAHIKGCKMLITVFVALQESPHILAGQRQAFIAFNALIGYPLNKDEVDLLESGKPVPRPSEIVGEPLLESLCRMFPIEGYEGLNIRYLRSLLVEQILEAAGG